MKRIFGILFFCAAVFAFSQSYSGEIERQFRDYTQLIADKSFEKALDTYVNEDFLNLIPKDQMLQMMDQVFNSKEMEFVTYGPRNLKIQETVLKNGGTNYVKLNYDQRMDMKFNSDTLPKEQLLAALKREFGEDYVKYNEKTLFYEIETHKDAIASSKDLRNWKFTVLEREQMPLLSQFLPKELLTP